MVSAKAGGVGKKRALRPFKELGSFLLGKGSHCSFKQGLMGVYLTSPSG